MTTNMDQRLARVEAVCEQLSKGQGEIRDALQDQSKWLRQVLYGTNGTAGHQVRLDRLEQRWAAARWLFGSLLAVLAAAAAVSAL